MTLTADFEKGTNGSVIAAADPGSLAAWDSVNSSGSNPSYSNAQVAHGSLSCAMPVLAAQQRLVWSTAFGTRSTSWFGRMYIYWVAGPSGTNQFVRWQIGTSPMIQFNNVRQLLAQGPVNTLTSSTVFALNTWYRVEWNVTPSLTTGFFEVKIYAGDSITPLETLTTTVGVLLASYAQAQFGNISPDLSTSFFLDQIVEQAAAYPGPFPVNTTAPSVSGSAPVGSTLTVTPGVWNSGGTFTLTYQWTRDGSPIGGATATSYVTQAADVGHAVGMTETATGVQATNESASQASSNTILVTGSGGGSLIKQPDWSSDWAPPGRDWTP